MSTTKVVAIVEEDSSRGRKNPKGTIVPKSLQLAKAGITTADEFASLMSALMSDLIEGAVSPEVGSVTCQAGGRMLRVIELQHRYGQPASSGGRKQLRLTGS